MARKKRESEEINAGSMADIAFLLLIFFLVTTTMNANKGVSGKLPPWVEEEIIVDLHERNVLNILVNAHDQLLVKGEMMDIKDLRLKTIEFLKSDGSNPDLPVSSKTAVVSIKNDRGTSYEVYIQVQNELKAAYKSVRDELAMQKYNMTYGAIREKMIDPLLPISERNEYKEKAKAIKEVFPMKISEAEPENHGA